MNIFNSEITLGIDIRDESVALILVRKNQKKFEVIASHFTRIPLLDSFQGESDEFLFNEVEQFIKLAKITPDSVALSLPRKYISVKSFDLPNADDESIDAMIEFELERLFSGSTDELSFSYAKTRKSGTQFSVIAAAIKKSNMQRFIDPLNKLKLKTVLLEASVFSNLNLLFPESNKTGGINVVVDVCSSSYEISVINNKAVEISRTVSIDADRFKENYFESHDPDKNYEMYCLGLPEEIVDEIATTLGACKNISENETVSEIFLIGGGNFNAILSEQIGKLSEVGTKSVSHESLKNLGLTNKFNSSFLLTALGLASREQGSEFYKINLLPTDPKAKSKRSQKSTALYLAAITCCLLIAFFASHFIRNQMTLEALDIQLKEVKSQAGSLQQIDWEYDSTLSIAQKINSAQKKNPLRLPVLQELSNVLPKDTWLMSVSIYQDKMEITGFSSSASRLVPLMENSPWFKNSRFMGSIVNGKKGEKFTIHTELAES